MNKNFLIYWFSWLYEKIFAPTSVFADAMEDNNFYSKALFVVIIVSLLSAIAYYYLINHSRWNKNRIWAFFGIFWTSIVSGVYSFFQYKQFDVLGYMDIAFLEYFWFWLYLFIISFILYIIFSWLIRQWSKNCSEVPSFLPRIINFKKNK